MQSGQRCYAMPVIFIDVVVLIYQFTRPVLFLGFEVFDGHRKSLYIVIGCGVMMLTE